MRKIRILMVLGNSGRGGSQAYSMYVLRSIDRIKFQIDFAYCYEEEGDFSDEMRSLGSKTYLIPSFRMVNYYQYQKAWRQLLSQNNYDIIHGHATGAASIYLKLAKEYNCTTIAHSHSDGYRGNVIERFFKNLMAKKVKQYSDYWFACSPKAANRLFGEDYKTYKNYYEIPNAIDVETYKFNLNIRNNVRKKLGINEDTFLVGHVGSMSVPKNHHFLIHVFDQVLKIKPNSKLLLLGDGPLETEVRTLVDEMRLSDQVIFTRTVPNVKDYLFAMDVMVFPSLFEGFGIAVLEAEAAGLYTIVSDTVPQEVILCDYVKALSLSLSYSEWAKEAINVPNFNRSKLNSIIAKTKYNSQSSVLLLSDLYRNMVKNK